MQQSTSDVVLVIVAAGRGLRAGGDVPKQYRMLGSKPVLAHTIEALLAPLPEATAVVVISPEDQNLYDQSLAFLPNERARILPPVHGGATRQDSVRAGLEAATISCKNAKYVLIHDAARPFSSSELTIRAFESAKVDRAAVPGCPIVDSVKRISDAGVIVDAPARETLRTVQTPQAFELALILDAHRRAAAAGVAGLTDDAAVAQWAGHPVCIFDGDPANIKLTTPEDFAMAEERLLSRLADIRVGQGFDVHAFAEGHEVWLGGVAIPHERGLEGHSDADVALHALTDAIFGALADGDIGSHFPPSDARWRGAASDIFLKEAVRRVCERGGFIAHLDLTVICEAPKVGPHRDRMRARIAEIAGLSVDRVAVKATTTERLGFTGRGEGIAATATATIRLPFRLEGSPT